jgi:hypothetical protein
VKIDLSGEFSGARWLHQFTCGSVDLIVNLNVSFSYGHRVDFEGVSQSCIPLANLLRVIDYELLVWAINNGDICGIP